MRTATSLGLAASLTVLAACQGSDGAPGSGPAQTFDAIAPTETVFVTGTEPFWSLEIEDGQALYKTPQDPDGERLEVARFAGNNGLAYNGRIAGGSLDAMITPGACSDGMSDRTYPYTATLLVGGQQRNGCAWTDRQPFTGPATP